MITTNFGDFIAARMRKEHQALAGHWFDRLLDILPVKAREIFPTQSLLDHVPALILEISDYLRQPEGEAIASNTAILEKARELGALRYEQRASLHQVLREYQVLGGVLTTFVFEQLECAGASPTPAEAAQLVLRLQRAVDVLAQATVEEFVGLYTKTIADQAERLDQFNRMAAHEWRQPLAALQWGVRALRETALDRPTLERTLAAVERSVEHLIDLTHKLETIARVRSDGDNPVVQAVSISTVGHEAARQLREMADARGVDIRIADEQPELTVDVGRLELAFVNLLSNAIKYSDPDKQERYVEIAAEEHDDWVHVYIRDNGIGIPRAALATVFQRFTRAHVEGGPMGHVGGIGLGLAIVEDCVRSMRGHIDVQSEEKLGTTFTLRLPTHGT